MLRVRMNYQDWGIWEVSLRHRAEGPPAASEAWSMSTEPWLALWWTSLSNVYIQRFWLSSVFQKQSQELHLALHLLNVPFMSNARKCGCLKSQGIRFPLSSFLMDTYHTLWSKNPLLSQVTGPCSLAPWASAVTYKKIQGEGRSISQLQPLASMPGADRGQCCTSAEIHRPIVPDKRNTHSSIQQQQFNKEQEQLKQLAINTSYSWAELVMALSPLWYLQRAL